MDKVRNLMADIVNTMSAIERDGLSKAECDKEVKRLNISISNLQLVREHFSCSTLLTAMLCEVHQRKRCLAYQYNGKLYTVARNVPNHESTDYLHTLGLSMDQWDALPQFSVWIGTGKVFE